jgi:hypothetical protein
VLDGTLNFLSSLGCRGYRPAYPTPPPRTWTSLRISSTTPHEHLTMWRAHHEKTGGVVHIDEVPGVRGRMSRREPGVVLMRWFASWSSCHPSLPTQHHSDHHEAARLLLSGLREDHRRSALLLRPVVERLSDGQQPQAMVLICAESRIVPNVITSCGLAARSPSATSATSHRRTTATWSPRRATPVTAGGGRAGRRPHRTPRGRAGAGRTVRHRWSRGWRRRRRSRRAC